VLATFCFVALPDTPRLVAFHDASPVASHLSDVNTAAQVPHAAIIPAAMKTSAVPLTAVAPRKSEAIGIYRPVQPVETRGAKREQIKARTAFVGPAIVQASRQQEVPVPQTWFVMQTAHFGEGGSRIMRLSVWRVTVDDQNRETIQHEVIVRLL